jgi:hypothetical protein
MAKTNNSGDDILLNINVTGREEITGARNDAKSLRNEFESGAKVDTAAPVKTLRQQIKLATIEAQNLVAQGKQNTEEFRKAAARVAELKDRQEDLNRTFKAFDPDNKFRVFNTAAQAGAKIVQGYAGAMAFLGVNSKSAQETIAELQGIMAFTDAIGSLHDLKDTYKDLLTVLGLNTKAAQVAADAQAEYGVEAESSATAQIAAQEKVTLATEALSKAQIEADEAMNAVRLEGLDATAEATAAELAYLEAAAARKVAVEQLAAAEAELAGVTGAATEATVAQTVANEGATVAEEAATVGAISFGAALKAIGIGLIISALAYLITNFQSIKKSVTDLFPGLKQAGDLFNKFKEICYGVGNVILQYIAAPIRAIVDAVKGDFKKAVQDLKDGFDVVKNFQAGVAYEAANIAAEQAKKRVQLEVEANERIIAERKALGKETAELEQQNIKLKISLLDKDKLSEEDYEKQRLDLISEGTVARNAEWKKRHDKYLELLKQDLDAAKANEKENFKIVQEGLADQRAVELSDIDTKYNAELKLLNKRRAENKNYNKDYADLVQARKIEEARVNKKYDDQIFDYANEVNNNYLDSFEKKEEEVKKKVDDLLKNASPEEKALLQRLEKLQLDQNNKEKGASQTNDEQKLNLTKQEDQNRAEQGDSAKDAATKVTNVEIAKIDAENAAYELRKVQLAGQQSELEQLDADHQKNLHDIEEEGSQARKDIAKAEQEAKVASLEIAANAADAASQLVGESTVAGKALAVAAATISTYTSAQKAYESVVGTPYVGPVLAVIAAASAVAIGIANVKKILSVQVPTKGGKGGSLGGANSAPSAPVINSTVLNQSNNGTKDVVDAVNQKNNAPAKPLKAYIVNKDLKDQAAQNTYYDQQSTY